MTQRTLWFFHSHKHTLCGVPVNTKRTLAVGDSGWWWTGNDGSVVAAGMMVTRLIWWCRDDGVEEMIGVASGSSMPSIHRPRGKRSNKNRLFSSSRRSESSLPPVAEEFPWDPPDPDYKLTKEKSCIFILSDLCFGDSWFYKGRIEETLWDYSDSKMYKDVSGSFIEAACENMIGGTRMRLGDKVTASNGKTIE
nr:leucine aminopeptidase 2, chloroplastic-like [Tanacetum cinerariifolium]